LECSAVLKGRLNPWHALVLIRPEGVVDILGGSVVWRSMHPICQHNCITQSIGCPSTVRWGKSQDANEGKLIEVNARINGGRKMARTGSSLKPSS